MRYRSVAVAFQEIESPSMRAFRHAWNQMTVDEILAEPKVIRRDSFWCGADRPREDRELKLVPLYPGSDVPEDAECEVCHIKIRDLQVKLRASWG